MNKPIALLALSCAIAASLLSPAMAAPGTDTTSVVLVHGAFADGSGWQGVADELHKSGINVAVVQEPETSFADDVKATRRIIDAQPGKVVLVGHSYGGSVITEAGNDPKVSALVYVAAFAPDTGESTGDVGKKAAPPAGGDSVKPTPDGYLYVDPANFQRDFAADLAPAQAHFMALSQVLTNAQAFGTPITTAAWHSKPSWAVVATSDRMINPDLERLMYKRTGSKVTELPGSHAVYVSHAAAVAKVIKDALAGSAKSPPGN